MKHLLSAAFALFLIASPAGAQGMAPIAKDTVTTTTTTTAVAPVELPHSEIPLAPGETASVPATTTETPGDDLLNKYYDRCMATVYTDLTTDAREEFCACSAAQMKDSMSAGEMVTLTGGAGGAEVDLIKLATNVVAPCFAPVAQELEYNRCEASDAYVHMYKSREAFDATCRCIGGRAGDYVQSYGRDLMAYTLALNPSRANDPAQALRSAPEYRQEVAKALNPCMNRYVYH